MPLNCSPAVDLGRQKDTGWIDLFPADFGYMAQSVSFHSSLFLCNLDEYHIPEFEFDHHILDSVVQNTVDSNYHCILNYIAHCNLDLELDTLGHCD